MRKRNFIREPHGSPFADLEMTLKECPDCNGNCHIDGETCYCCDGTGTVEMTPDEIQNHYESREEEFHED